MPESPARRIDFYLLDGDDADQRLVFACRLVDKARHRGHTVYVRVADERAAEQLDALLWTFSAGSFVPHARHQAGSPADCPVLIGTGPPPASHRAVLINLSDEVPDWAGDAIRVIEIVDASPTGKTAGRARFRAYRQQGIEPHAHSMRP